MTPNATILEAMVHPAVWGLWFKDAATWAPWRAFLAALFTLPMTEADLALYQECTGRETPPPGGTTEAWLVCGRRAGKSFILALIAVYLAVFRDWRPYLSPGETGTIKVLATDRRQARVIHRYCRALLTKVPTLAGLVVHEGDDEIELSNGIVIEIQTANFRSVRGHTIIAALCDEIAYWRSDETSANPDSEVLAALRPAMATIPGAMLLCASSPYAQRGELYRAFRRYHGHDDAPALVWRAATRTMNPTVRQSIIDEAMEEDPAKAAAEYGAEFRTDVETFIPREVVESLIVPGRYELPPMSGVSYSAFTDPSGGRSDSMTLAIAHRDKDGRAILDAVRERRPPFSPEAVVDEFLALMKTYRCSRVTGDNYAAEWSAERFRAGATYDKSERVKSAIYLESLPMMNSGKIELLNHPRLINQITGLERRTARGGKDSVDHPPGAHDDLANAALGALVIAAGGKGPIIITAAMMQQARSMTRHRGFDAGSMLPGHFDNRLGRRNY